MKLLPLLGGKVDVEEITLRDPVITILKNAQGQLNISTLGAKPQVSSPKPEVPAKAGGSPLQALALFAVDRVSIDGGILTYRDESTTKPTEYTVKDLEFLLTSVHLGESPRVQASATVQPYNLPIRVDGHVWSPGGNARPQNIQLQPRLGQDCLKSKRTSLGGNLDATISALQIDTAELPVKLPLTKSVQVKDLHLTLHAPYPIPPDAPATNQIDVTDLGLTLVMGGSAINIKGTAAKGRSQFHSGVSQHQLIRSARRGAFHQTD